jgi:hypothetical protein
MPLSIDQHDAIRDGACLAVAQVASYLARTCMSSDEVVAALRGAAAELEGYATHTRICLGDIVKAETTAVIANSIIEVADHRVASDPQKPALPN